MTLLGELRGRARHIVGPVLAATVFAYFAFHAVQGDRGILAWIKLGQQVEEARLELAHIHAERDELARRVRLLRPGSLDPDLLEERVRAILGYVGKNDVVIGTAIGGRYVTGSGPGIALPNNLGPRATDRSVAPVAAQAALNIPL